MAFALIARQLHLGPYCVYVADETVFTAASGAAIAGVTIDPNAYHADAACQGRHGRAADRTDLTGCPWHDVKSMLRQVGLRPTRQRMALGWIFVRQGRPASDRRGAVRRSHPRQGPGFAGNHLQHTAPVSRKSGCCARSRSTARRPYFDTNASAHHHFFVEGDDTLLDIPVADVIVGKTPAPPEGYEVARVDVVVRLRRKV